MPIADLSRPRQPEQQQVALIHDPGNYECLNTLHDVELFREACRRCYEGPGGAVRTDFAASCHEVLNDLDTFRHCVQEWAETKQASSDGR